MDIHVNETFAFIICHLFALLIQRVKGFYAAVCMLFFILCCVYAVAAVCVQ